MELKHDPQKAKEDFTKFLVNTPGYPEDCKFAENTIKFFFDRKDYWFGNPSFLTLPQAKRIFDVDADYRDFVYIRPWSVVFFDVTAITSHEIFLSGMWAFFNACKTGENWGRHLYGMCYANTDSSSEPRERLRDNAEMFLMDHYGFYASSAYGNSAISISKSFVKNAQERRVFSAFNFREMVD